MPRRQYSDSDQAAALAFYDAARGNLAQAARLSSVPRNTLRRWVNERSLETEGVESATLSTPISNVESSTPKVGKGEVLRRWEELRDSCFEDLKLARLDATFRDLVTAAKAATDMVLTLKGTYDDDDIEELMAEWVAVVKKHVKDEQTQAAISQDLRRAAERLRGESRSG